MKIDAHNVHSVHLKFAYCYEMLANTHITELRGREMPVKDGILYFPITRYEFCAICEGDFMDWDEAEKEFYDYPKNLSATNQLFGSAYIDGDVLYYNYPKPIFDQHTLENGLNDEPVY